VVSLSLDQKKIPSSQNVHLTQRVILEICTLTQIDTVSRSSGLVVHFLIFIPVLILYLYFVIKQWV